jgi:hypothetical protein
VNEGRWTARDGRTIEVIARHGYLIAYCASL